MPRCGWVEHGLEYFSFYAQKHIACLTAYSAPPTRSRWTATGARISDTLLFTQFCLHYELYELKYSCFFIIIYLLPIFPKNMWHVAGNRQNGPTLHFLTKVHGCKTNCAISSRKCSEHALFTNHYIILYISQAFSVIFLLSIVYS